MRPQAWILGPLTSRRSISIKILYTQNTDKQTIFCRLVFTYIKYANFIVIHYLKLGAVLGMIKNADKIYSHYFTLCFYLLM